MSKSITNRMTEGPILPQLARFAIPFFVSFFLQNLYNVVDMIVVGQFVGSAGLSAVTISGQASFIMTSICVGISEGGHIVASQYVGADDKKGISETTGTLFSLCIIASAIMMIIGLGLYRPLLRWVDTPAESMKDAREYMFVICLGTFFTFGYNVISALLRGMGDSKRPMYFVAIASVVNIIGDLILVGLFDLSALGAAIATIFAQAVSVAISIVYLYKKRDMFGFDFKPASFRIRPDKLKKMLKIGIPTAVEMSVVNISFLYMIALINGYGVAATAAYGVGSRVDGFIRMPAQSVASSLGTLVGQNVGARKIKRVKKIMVIGVSLTFALSILGIIVVRLFPEQLFGIFTSDPDTIAMGLRYVKVMCWCYLCMALMNSFNALARGSGAAIIVMIGGIMDGFVFRLGLAWLFTSVLAMGFEGVLWGACLAPGAAGLIALGYCISGKWKTKTLIDAPADAVDDDE